MFLIFGLFVNPHFMIGVIKISISVFILIIRQIKSDTGGVFKGIQSQSVLLGRRWIDRWGKDHNVAKFLTQCL